LRHDRDQAGRRDHAGSHIGQLCGRALCLRVHCPQLLRRDVLHPQARAVEGEAVAWPHALAFAQQRVNLGLHRRV
jgi:hypothetical protein